MDPQQQQHIATMMASMGVAFLLFGLLISAFFIFLFWRIFTKAGLAGPLSLLVLVPGVGFIICLCIAAFSEWRVIPASQGYNAGLPPAYPPPAYPPANYPPSSPPAL